MRATAQGNKIDMVIKSLHCWVLIRMDTLRPVANGCHQRSMSVKCFSYRCCLFLGIQTMLCVISSLSTFLILLLTIHLVFFLHKCHTIKKILSCTLKSMAAKKIVDKNVRCLILKLFESVSPGDSLICLQVSPQLFFLKCLFVYIN